MGITITFFAVRDSDYIHEKTLVNRDVLVKSMHKYTNVRRKP